MGLRICFEFCFEFFLNLFWEIFGILLLEFGGWKRLMEVFRNKKECSIESEPVEKIG